MNDVVVIDNAIPKQTQIEFDQLCLHANFPWHYHPTSAYSEEQVKHIPESFKKDSVDTPFFGHLLYNNNVINSDFFHMFRPIVESIPDINTSKLVRFKLNLTMPNPHCNKNTHSFPHTDIEGIDNYVTAVYYINDSDGDTFFFNNDLTIKQRVAPKRGRLVVFDGKTLHAGNNPYNGARVTANINLGKQIQ